MLIFTPKTHRITINDKELEAHQWESLELVSSRPKRLIDNAVVTESLLVKYDGYLYLYPHSDYAKEMDIHDHIDGFLAIETIELGTMKNKKFEGVIASRQKTGSYLVSLASE